MTKEWIINWFIKNSSLTEVQVRENTSANYFEQHWLDSFEFINFVTDLEEQFSISFSNDEFQNRNFATIDGLAKIIEEKLHG